MARLIIGKSLLVLALPLVFLGLIDPLEGGLALIAAFFVYALAFVLLRHKPSKFLWLSFLAAVIVGAAALALAISRLEFSNQPTGLPIPVVVLLWGYRVAVISTLIAGILTVVKIFKKPN